jgi:hypothetical protein
MPSQPLQTTFEAHETRQADREHAAELTRKYQEWTVWSARDGRTRLATHAGESPRTLMGDSWTDLELQLANEAEQA